MPVGLVPVDHGIFKRHVRVPGIVHMKSEATLSFMVGGVVTRVAVREGDRVRKGQVLAALDATTVDADRLAALEAARKAERDLARARLLSDTASISTADLENARTALVVAHATAEAAQFSYRHATLVALEDGVIDQRRVDVGQVVAPGLPAFHLSGFSQGAVVRAAFASRDVVRMHVGDLAHVTLDVAPEQSIVARVVQIGAAASPGTAGYEVELSLDTPAYVRTGLTAKVEIEQAEVASAVIPVGALRDGDATHAFAYVVNEGKATRVPVEIRFVAGDMAVLGRGLETESEVVKAGLSNLTEGVRVRVLRCGIDPC